MLLTQGDLIPVEPEATTIPWTRRKSQILNFLHRGPVDFNTLVYDTNVGDISAISTYFNPERVSVQDLNSKFGQYPSASQDRNDKSEAGDMKPRLLLYPEHNQNHTKIQRTLKWVLSHHDQDSAAADPFSGVFTSHSSGQLSPTATTSPSPPTQTSSSSLLPTATSSTLHDNSWQLLSNSTSIAASNAVDNWQFGSSGLSSSAAAVGGGGSGDVFRQQPQQRLSSSSGCGGSSVLLLQEDGSNSSRSLHSSTDSLHKMAATAAPVAPLASGAVGGVNKNVAAAAAAGRVGLQQQQRFNRHHEDARQPIKSDAQNPIGYPSFSAGIEPSVMTQMEQINYRGWETFTPRCQQGSSSPWN